MNLKVCGMKYKKNINEVSNLKPNFMGFIFWPETSRYFNSEKIDIPNNIFKVGVFVNQSFEIIKEKIYKFNLDYVQLHGDEKVHICKKLNQITKIIKVFRVGENIDFNKITPYENYCDYFLFDTEGKKYGGSGKKFNWKILRNYKSKKPFFLSGGIDLNDFNELKKIFKLDIPFFGIDINSRFEIKPGLKDDKKIKELIEKIKNE